MEALGDSSNLVVSPNPSMDLIGLAAVDYALKDHLLVYGSIILFFEPRRLFKPEDQAVFLQK